MLDISNAVHARNFSALSIFALAGNPKKTHSRAHWKTWNFSGAITLFMVVQLSRLFMTQLDLWVSAAESVR
jgi:hypothetical protein